MSFIIYFILLYVIIIISYCPVTCLRVIGACFMIICGDGVDRGAIRTHRPLIFLSLKNEYFFWVTKKKLGTQITFGKLSP